MKTVDLKSSLQESKSSRKMLVKHAYISQSYGLLVIVIEISIDCQAVQQSVIPLGLSGR